MEEDVIVKVAVPLMSDDRRALGHVRPEPAGMIEVVVGVHDVPNRLVRNEPPDFGDDG